MYRCWHNIFRTLPNSKSHHKGREDHHFIKDKRHVKRLFQTLLLPMKTMSFCCVFNTIISQASGELKKKKTSRKKDTHNKKNIDYAQGQYRSSLIILTLLSVTIYFLAPGPTNITLISLWY